ncbi:MAG: hypothetical protein QNK92_12265 [Amylibacter sp.]
MTAAGLSDETIDRSNPKPFIIGLISVIIVAGMMRHIFISSGVDTVGYGALSDFGMGAVYCRAEDGDALRVCAAPVFLNAD